MSPSRDWGARNPGTPTNGTDGKLLASHVVGGPVNAWFPRLHRDSSAILVHLCRQPGPSRSSPPLPATPSLSPTLSPSPLFASLLLLSSLPRPSSPSPFSALPPSPALLHPVSTSSLPLLLTHIFSPLPSFSIPSCFLPPRLPLAFCDRHPPRVVPRPAALTSSGNSSETRVLRSVPPWTCRV